MTHASSAPATSSSPVPGAADISLGLLVIFAWSTSWIGVHYQLGEVAPEVSVMWRFLLAGTIMTAWCLARGEALLGFSRRDHLMFAALGVTLFSMNFVLFYYSGTMLVSGMLSVVFALAAPGNVLVQSLVLKRPVSQSVAVGSLIGVLGVGMLFAPEIIQSGIGHVGGLLLALVGTAIFCAGNLVSARLQARGIQVAPANAWGMFYGAALLAVIAVVRGLEFKLVWTATYLGSLVYLALVASALAFMAYLSLLKRLGPARAGYLTVLLPAFALMISSVLEDYQWTAWSFAGLTAVAIGNVLVLWRR